MLQSKPENCHQFSDWLQLAETVSACAYFWTANKCANEPETTLKTYHDISTTRHRH